MAEDLIINPRIVIPGDELRWVAVRSSGPGGQNVNKVATKVDLRFDFWTSSALSTAVKTRLSKLAAARLDADGRLVVVSQLTRNQERNLRDAREKLAALIRRAVKRPKPRVLTKPSRAAKRRRLEDKRHLAEKKRSRAPVSRSD